MKWLMLFVFSLFGCDDIHSDSEGAKSSFRIGSSSLEVPTKYIFGEIPRTASTLDSGDELNLKIPLSDLGVGKGVSEGLTHNVILLISPLSEHYAAYDESPDALAAWRGAGLYESRKVHYDETAKLFRVEPSASKGKMWHYFRTSPEADKSEVGKWIAGCMVGPLEEEAEDLSNAICDSAIKIDGLQIELSFSGKNVRTIDEIEMSVMELAEKWIVVASDKGETE